MSHFIPDALKGKEDSVFEDIRRKSLAARKKRYLEDPDSCPYCGSGNICEADHDFGYKSMYRTIRCSSCSKTWTEQYDLVDITEDEEVPS